jgi:hypothetical protein
MSFNRGQNRARNLRVLQVNVRRSWPVHNCALETAFQTKADIILIQEPETVALNHCTQAYEAYRTLVPQDRWPTRPRIMPYNRKDNGLTAVKPSGLSSDLLEVAVSGRRFPLCHIWNVYNSPAGSAGAGEAVNLLVQQQIQPNILIAGDFNLRHSAWDYTPQHDSPDSARLEFWAAD